MNTNKRIIASVLAASAAVAIAAPAQAQVSGIAYANPAAVVDGSKAFDAANSQISNTYKSAFEQIQQRRDAMQKEIEPLLTQIDTNKDKQLSEDEIKAAQAAKSPVLDKVKAAQTNAENDINKLGNPAARAELFAIESILRQYEAAQLRVVTAKKISVVLTPEVFMYAPESANISSAIVAELDKALPTVGIAPPADWTPSRDTLSIQQQLIQIQQIRAYQQAAQQQGAARPAAPAAGPAKPATATGPGAAKPATPEPR